MKISNFGSKSETRGLMTNKTIRMLMRCVPARCWFRGLAATIALGSLFLTPLAQAGMITFFTPAGSMGIGQDLSARADITTGADTVTIVLTNLQEDPTAAVQNISGFTFVLSTGQTAGTLTSSFGTDRTVDSDTTYSDGGVVATGWALETIPLKLNLLGTPTAPIHTIIGPPDSGTDTYASANPSIRGNGPHNPFLAETATFVLNVPGVTMSSTVDSVIFSFNTSPGTDIPGVPAPEPSSLWLIGLGAAMAIALVRRRRNYG